MGEGDGEAGWGGWGWGGARTTGVESSAGRSRSGWRGAAAWAVAAWKEEQARGAGPVGGRFGRHVGCGAGAREGAACAAASVLLAWEEEVLGGGQLRVGISDPASAYVPVFFYTFIHIQTAILVCIIDQTTRLTCVRVV